MLRVKLNWRCTERSSSSERLITCVCVRVRACVCANLRSYIQVYVLVCVGLRGREGMMWQRNRAVNDVLLLAPQYMIVLITCPRMPWL
jgi:hypothetical protein